MAYVYGVEDVNRSLGISIEPDLDQMRESIYKEIDDETWLDRFRDIKTFSELERLVKTEAGRDFSEGQYNTADGRATHKTWITMGDDRVRDTHWYLEDMTVEIGEYFYTIDGDYALHPFGFLEPSNNVGCRCKIKYSKRG